MSGTTLLDAVLEIARATGAVALRGYGRRIDVVCKDDGSPVTAADRAAETAAREWIMARFPHDGIVGEEMPAHQPNAKRQWYVDPIDGTRTFVAGVPLWGTLVAVCEGETVLAGAAAFPAVDEYLAAAPGLGCWHNGSRCAVSRVASLDAAKVLTTSERFRGAPHRREPWQRLAEQAGTTRTWGDCYGYLLVATGRAEVMIDGDMKPWDAAALQPIINEAGGVFTDFNGQPTAFGDGTIATNGVLSQVVREILGVPA
jgi:histidinol-phosphatase